jgi:DnaJ domain
MRRATSSYGARVSLYDVLGVDPSASAAQLHAAYRARARHLHPDRWAQGTVPERLTAEADMQELNAAWAVLSDPIQREEYDRAAEPRPARPRAHDDPPPVDDAVFEATGVPWLARALPLALLLAVLAAIFVFTAFAARGPDDDGDREPLTGGAGADVGDCVLVAGGHVVEVVACSAPNQGQVQHVVDRTDACPPGERRIDGRDGSSALCVTEG